MDKYSLENADTYLEDLYNSLPYEKSGEELLRRMEASIRSHSPGVYYAITNALRGWLWGLDERKSRYAIDLIARLDLFIYIPDLKQIKS